MKKIKRVLLLVFTLLLIDTNILRADDYNGNSGEYDSSYSLHIKYDIAGTLPSGGGSSSGGGSTGTSSSGYIMSSAVMLKANLVNQDTLKVEEVFSNTIFNSFFKCKICTSFMIYKNYKCRCINSNLCGI